MRKPIQTAVPLMLIAALLTALAVFMAPMQPAALAASGDELAPAQAEVVVSDDSSIPPLLGGGPAAPIPFTGPPATLARPGATFTSGPNAPAITLWHGTTQSFGAKGDPQKWVNILGNVSGTAPIATLSYSLNGSSLKSLDRGPDNQRLAQTGDFNIEIDYTKLQPGNNTVIINAVDTNSALTTATVTINYQAAPTWTPQTLNYTWAGASSVTDVAQVVDGLWALDGANVRPVIFDYDRLLALGDLSWRDYTVTVPITVYSIDESGFFAPSNGPGVGVMVRWQGHYQLTNEEPYEGWRRLGALAWYRWQKDDPNQPTINSGFQLLGNGGQDLESDDRPLQTGTTYIFKLQVQSNADPTKVSTYRFKVWDSSLPEPIEWDFQENGRAGEPRNGGILLLAHHVDATFGPVTVNLSSVQPAPTLTVSKTGTGSGTVTAVPQKSSYRFGEEVQVSVAPAAGTVFQGWSGDLSGTANPATVTMFQDRRVTAILTDPSIQTPLSDDFSTCTLNTSLWQFINPLGDSTVSANGVQAQISVPGGVTHDAWTTGLTAPHLIQPMDNKDFTVETKIDTGVSQKTQFKGLLVKESDSRFIRYNIQHNGTETRLLAYTIDGGSSSKRFDQVLTPSGPPVHLRVNRVGSSWTLTYSTDGAVWQPASTFSFNMSVSGVGLFAGNANPNPPVVAQFDYFFNSAAPIAPEDGNSPNANVTIVGSGAVLKNPNKDAYYCGETVTLTAAPSAGWTFTGWSGALTGSESVKTIVLNKREDVTATFVTDAQYSLDTAVNGGGTVQKNPDKALYGAGEVVQLTAQPAIGSEFTGWSGDLTGTANPANLTMTKNSSVTANFQEAPLRTLTVTTQGSGSVTANPDKPGGYQSGESVTLTAVPEDGWLFAGWTGGLVGTQNPATLVMNADKQVNAIFTFAEDLTITLNAIGNGVVVANPAKPSYEFGEVVTVSAIPNAGHAFIGWSGDLSGYVSPAVITMTKNVVVNGAFGLDFQHSLELLTDGDGTINAEPSRPLYADGQVVKLTAVPGVGQRFIGWSGDLSGNTNPATLVMTKNSSVTANFVFAPPVDLLVNVDPFASGSVTIVPDKEVYLSGEVVTITAKAAAGFSFSGWEGDVDSHANPLVLTLDSDKNLVATFTDQAAVVSDDFNSCDLDTGRWQWIDPGLAADYSANGTEIVMEIPAGANYNLGTGGNFSARLMQPAPDTNFDVMAGFLSVPQTQFQFQGILVEQDGDNYLFAEFLHDGTGLKLYVITVQNGVASTKRVVTVAPTDELHMRVRRVADTWRVWFGADNTTPTLVGSLSHVMDVQAIGVFGGSHARQAGQQPGFNAILDYFQNNTAPIESEDGDTFSVDVAITGQGTVSKSPNKAVYACGEQVTLRATAAANWLFGGWGGDLSGSSTTQVLTVSGKHNILATFIQPGSLSYRNYTPIIQR